MQNLKIAIPPELFAPAEGSSFEGSFSLPEFQAGPDTYRFPEPLRYRVQVTNTSGAFLVTGIVEGTGVTECARCLETFDVPVSGNVEGYFVYGDDAQDAGQDEEETLQDQLEGEFDLLGPDNVIDLEPLLKASILVDLPLVPLCMPNCRGICQDCGINLNRQSCDCAQKRALQDAADKAAANPFAALAQLQFDEADSIPESAWVAVDDIAGEPAPGPAFGQAFWEGPGDIPEPPEPDYEGEAE